LGTIVGRVGAVVVAVVSLSCARIEWGSNKNMIAVMNCARQRNARPRLGDCG
jgi:hypothetical protein